MMQSRTRISVFLVCLTVWGQVAEEANSCYKTVEGRSRVAATLDAENRDERQKPEQLVTALELRPDMTVADIGTGAGYMLPFLNKAVGQDGKVIAQDIFPDFLDRARSKAAKTGLKNVQFVLGSVKDAALPAASADVVLILDAYHHFDYPAEMLASVRRALKPNGRLVVIEYHNSDEAMPNGRALTHIRLTQEGFLEEIGRHGFRVIEKHDHIPKAQWMGTFTAQ